MVPTATSVPPPVARKRQSSDTTTPVAKRLSIAKRPTSEPRSKVAPKKPSRPQTAASIEKEAADKRRNEAPQTAITFDSREKFPIGMKLLLTDEIYKTQVSFLLFNWQTIIAIAFLTTLPVCFLPAGTGKSGWLSI